MEKSIQDILDELEENKKKLKKKSKKSKFKEEKEQIKLLCFEERKKNPSITPFELSNSFGIDKDTAQKYLDEFIENSKKKDEKPIKKKNKLEIIKEKIKLIKKKFKKFIDKDDKITMGLILFKVIIFGLPINFALFVIFGIPFTWYSWIAWGYSFWFIKKEVVDFLCSIIGSFKIK